MQTRSKRPEETAEESLSPPSPSKRQKASNEVISSDTEDDQDNGGIQSDLSEEDQGKDDDDDSDSLADESDEGYDDDLLADAQDASQAGEDEVEDEVEDEAETAVDDSVETREAIRAIEEQEALSLVAFQREDAAIRDKHKQRSLDARKAFDFVHNTAAMAEGLLNNIPAELADVAPLKETLGRIKTKREACETIIVVRGPAGSGKSSLINIILEEEVLPTSSNEACTSVPTRIAYSKRKGVYTAEVHFLSKQDWHDELAHFCETRRLEILSHNQDYSQSGSAATLIRSSAMQTRQKRFSFESTLNKLETLFPAHRWGDLSDQHQWTVEEILNLPNTFFEKVGTVQKIKASSASQLRQRLERFDDPRACRFWPLITEIKIAVPSKLLRYGAVLIDLPGTGDENATRNEAAARYIRKYDQMWVCLDICRAKASKTMQEVLSTINEEQFHSGRGRISFIVTKCEQGTHILSRPYQTIIRDVPILRDDLAFKQLHDRYRELSVKIKRKRKALQNRSSKSGQSIPASTTLAKAQQEIDGLCAEQTNLKHQLATRYCNSRARVVQHALKQRYLLTTAKLIHKSKDESGQQLIYRTASEDCHKIENQLSDVNYAKSLEETGIPQLRRVISTLSSDKLTSNIIGQLETCKRLLLDISMQIGHIPSISVEERKSLGQRWGAHGSAEHPSVSEHLKLAFDKSIDSVFGELAAQIDQRGRAAIKYNSQQLQEDMAKRVWSSTRSTHWALFKSACACGGQHPYRDRPDVNHELALELIQGLEMAWHDSLVYSMGTLEQKLQRSLRRFVNDELSKDLKELTWAMCTEWVKQCLREMQDNIGRVVSDFEEQSRLNRIEHMVGAVATKIGGTLCPVYDEVKVYSGPGCTARRKSRICDFIISGPPVLGCTWSILKVNEMTQNMRADVQTVVDGLAHQVEAKFSRLWWLPDAVKQEGGEDLSEAGLSLKQLAEDRYKICTTFVTSLGGCTTPDGTGASSTSHTQPSTP